MTNLVRRVVRSAATLAVLLAVAACSNLPAQQSERQTAANQGQPLANSSARAPQQATATLHLTGNFFGSVLVINEQEPQKLERGEFATYIFEGRRFAAFDIPAGEVRVYITRGNRVVVDRTLQALPGNAVGLRVP